MRRWVRIVSLIAAIAGLTLFGPVAPVRAGGPRQHPPPPGKPIPFELPPRQELMLANGMRVTLIPYGSIPLVDVELVLPVGEIDEGPDQVWLSHLVAELLTQGTTTRSARKIAQDAAGMGGMLSVRVDTIETSISGGALALSAPEMVSLVADVARHPAFPAVALPRVKDELLRELAMEQREVLTRAEAKFRAALYPRGPLGRIYPSTAKLAGYTEAEVQQFYAAHVGAGHAHLYVVGRFDGIAVANAIGTAFVDWPRGPVPSKVEARTSTNPHAIFLLDQAGSVQSALYMGLPVPPVSSPDYIPLEVTNALLGGAFVSRITNDIREDKGYSYSPFSRIFPLDGTAYWAEVAAVTSQSTGPALREILKQIEGLRAAPPGGTELEGIENYLVGTFVLANASREGIVRQLDFARQNGLNDSYLTRYVQHVHAVTAMQVQRMAQRYLDPKRMTIVVAGDNASVASQLKAFGEPIR